MNTPDKILIDLLASQSSVDALAQRIRVPMLVIKSMCDRHEKDGLMTSFAIAETITVWRLTDKGIEKAIALKPSAAVPAESI